MAARAELDRKIEALCTELQPGDVLRPIPGAGRHLAPVLSGLLHSADRVRSERHIRGFRGLFPRRSDSGGTERPGQKITQGGNDRIKRALMLAADTARKIGPGLAEVCWRLVTGRGIITSRPSAPSPTGSSTASFACCDPASPASSATGTDARSPSPRQGRLSLHATPCRTPFVPRAAPTGVPSPPEPGKTHCATGTRSLRRWHRPGLHPARQTGAPSVPDQWRRDGAPLNAAGLANKRDAAARADRQGRTADLLGRLDFPILGAPGCLPFARTGGQLLRHLIRRPCECTSITVTATPAFGEWPVRHRSRTSGDAMARCSATPR